MGNIATSIKEQIQKLKNRGMDLDLEEDKIKEILLDIGYYRLGFYWNPFEIDENHNFAEGTKFSSIIDLYYLDVDLRSILTKYLYRIELNFRTKLIYYVSNKYKLSPTWFIDSKVINRDFIDAFDHFYDDDFINNNKPIKKHHAKYINDKYAPAWKTLEFFTFGSILKIYKSLNEEDVKVRISEIYGVKNYQKFINLFETIVYVRNCCAHSSILFDLNLPKSISAFAEIKFNGHERHNLDSCIKVILFILNKISTSRHDEMLKAIDDLFLSHKNNPVTKSIIENEIGYKFQ
ncbi:Abi family protein [Flavobacterium amniphilum]|uniref:Abi family protein n=1 Tax=Flavobacterium amniphilum TaxID=1834035 RepID=UPI00202A2F7C|nr:Abi family protein [Flavobacterium amniphilum]MCL9807573.1 Abi family protein [Flavobacterium amniphilum]